MKKLKFKGVRKFKFKSLTMRIWTIFTAIILIIICSISFFYFVAFRKISENAKIQDLMVAHDILLKDNEFSQPNRFDELRNLKESGNFIYKKTSSGAQIIELNKKQMPQGGMPNGIHPPLMGDQNNLEKWMISFIGNEKVYEKQFIKKYSNMKYIFIISTVSDSSSGKTYLISYTPDTQDNSILYMVIIIGIVFIGIGFITAKIVAGNISKPLKELENYTKKIARKDWKEPIETKSEDEIGSLANSMNHMQRELKRADEEEKMFLQSISHDLKTPVMVIMSHADAIIDGVYIDSVEKTAEIIKTEAISLEKKIKQMLYLNTLDYVMENNNEDTDINLHELLLHIINRFEMINSKIEWDLNIDNIIINGNSDKIQVSIENIIDNGLRYAKGKMGVTLKKEGQYAVLDIFDDGPNIDEKHMSHIFDHLYKDKTGNFGLGLAITKKIIDFHGGEIKALNRENGVSFIIKLPIKSDQQL